MITKALPAPSMRAGDADRERTVARLGEARAAGRITLDELDERTGAAYRATTHAELAALVADLPGAVAPSPSPGGRRDWILGLFGREARGGAWRLGPRTIAVSVCGSSVLDLRHAELDAGPITVRTVGFLGSVRVLVPPGVPVTVGGRGLLGSVARYGLSSDRPDPAIPHVHIEALAVLGSVEVRRVRPRRRLRDRLTGR